MQLIATKKTVNLHKYSLMISDIISNRRFVLPIVFLITGIVFGCACAKGDRGMYVQITEFFKNTILNDNTVPLLSNFIRWLLIPTVFCAIIFFLGLSIFGMIIVNSVPFAYGIIIGIISYFLYQNYTLKGLAYCVLLIFPYAVISSLGLVICSKEGITMSEYITNNVTRSKKHFDYSFNKYCKLFFKGYLLVVISSLIKIILDNLFINLF